MGEKAYMGQQRICTRLLWTPTYIHIYLYAYIIHILYVCVSADPFESMHYSHTRVSVRWVKNCHRGVLKAAISGLKQPNTVFCRAVDGMLRCLLPNSTVVHC